MLKVDFNIINQKGSPAIYSDVLASRPAASYPGRLFISTDTKEIFRDTGSAWEEIAGQGSGNVQGSGTANYVSKWTDSETLGNSLIRDNGTSVGIGTAPSGTYYLDIAGSQRNTLTGAGGFTLLQNGTNVAAYGVYDSASANAFLFSKTGSTNQIYSVGKIEHKIFDGATNYYISEFSTGNFSINSQTDAGYKLDVNGTGRFSGEIRSTVGNGGVILSDYSATTGVLFVADTITTGGRLQVVTENSVGNNAVSNSTPYAAMFGNAYAYDTILFTNQSARLIINGTTGAATFSGSIAINNTVTAAASVPSTHKVTMVIGGTTYYLLASNV